MSDEPKVQMPAHLTIDEINAVRSDPLCCVEDKEEEHRRIGWLICAYDVLVRRAKNPEQAK